jgi:hypothetical protein
MGRWRVWIPDTEIELEANDEGDALMQACRSFDPMSIALAEELPPEDEPRAGKDKP